MMEQFGYDIALIYLRNGRQNKMGSIVEQVKGNLTIESVLMMAMKMPGVKIDRKVFLKKELIKYCREDIVEAAIKENPAKAGISKEVINKISKSVIDYETTKVTTASVIASLPSSVNFGVAVGASTADIVVYFTHIIRVVQELAYLYGFGQFDFGEDNVDSETMRFLMLFMGVMFGVQGASTTLKKFADIVAKAGAESTYEGHRLSVYKEDRDNNRYQDDKADLC